MSIENVQDAAPTAGSEGGTSEPVLGESTAAATSSEVATGGVDKLRQIAKDSSNQTGAFSPKSVDDAMKAAAAPIVPAPNAYTPNFKYKAALQEKEVDEFWRGLIKDEGSEKKVKEALQKLDGFDAVKTSRERLTQEYQSLSTDYKNQQAVVDRVEGALQRNDLTSAFRQLGVTPEQVFRWTQEQLQRMELPPEQRRAFEEAEQLKTQQLTMQEQMTQYQSMYEDQAVQARTVHLDLVLSRQEVSQTAERWDQLMGQHGAFRDQVVQEAQNAWYQQGKDLSAEQAVQIVMSKFGKVLSGQQMPGIQSQPEAMTAQQMQQPPQMQVHAPQAKPVIPNINGKGTAPIKRVPKSLDDLKKMAKELQASE